VLAELHLHLYGCIRPADLLRHLSGRENILWDFYEADMEAAYGSSPQRARSSNGTDEATPTRPACSRRSSSSGTLTPGTSPASRPSSSSCWWDPAWEIAMPPRPRWRRR
jgi:hypothetical protein